MTVKAVSEQVSVLRISARIRGSGWEAPPVWIIRGSRAASAASWESFRVRTLVAAVAGRVGSGPYLDSQDHDPIGFDGFQRREDTAASSRSCPGLSRQTSV